MVGLPLDSVREMCEVVWLGGLLVGDVVAAVVGLSEEVSGYCRLEVFLVGEDYWGLDWMDWTD
jgi:hypothetical protein